MKKEDLPGTASGVVGSSGNYADNVILGASRGHGFAGEKANHLASNTLEPIIEEIVKSRKTISLPTDEQLAYKTGQVIEELSMA